MTVLYIFLLYFSLSRYNISYCVMNLTIVNY